MLGLLFCALSLAAGGDQGTCKEGVRCVKDELAAVDRMLDRNPPMLEQALPLLVDLAMHKPRNRKAEKHLRKLIKITKKRFDQLGAHAKKPHRAAIAYADSSYLLAKHLLRVKAPQQEIMAALEVTVREDPSHDNAKHWLAHQLSRAPRGEARCVELLDSIQLERLTDNHPLDTLMLLGQAQERVGKLTEAIAAFRRASDLYREEGSQSKQMEDRIRFRYGLAHFQLCRLLLLAGQPNEAVQAAMWSKREFPPVYQITDVLSNALATVGRLPDAISNYHEKVQQMKQWPAEAWREMPERVFGSTLAWMLERSNGWGAQSEEITEETPKETPKEGTEEKPALVPGGDGGGWEQWSAEVGELVPGLDGSMCNIDRREALSREDFLAEYANKNRPVLVRNELFSSNSSSRSLLEGWPGLKRWRREEFLQSYGSVQVEVRPSSYVAYDNEFGGMPKRRMTIEEYVQHWPTHSSPFNQSAADVDATAPAAATATAPLFVGPDGQADAPYILSNAPLVDAGVHNDYREPALFAGDDDDRRIFAHNRTQRGAIALFYVGPALSGVSLHQHTNAWNGLVYGRKRWYLLPPYALHGPTGLPMLDWLKNFYPKLKATGQLFECTQEAGEVLYVPTDWYHGILNLQASVGVAVEFGHHKRLLYDLLDKHHAHTP